MYYRYRHTRTKYHFSVCITMIARIQIESEELESKMNTQWQRKVVNSIQNNNI